VGFYDQSRPPVIANRRDILFHGNAPAAHRLCRKLQSPPSASFQNRYKSILYEKDPYLKQRVGYIHLNPFRAGIVATVPALRTYPFTGHCALMGKKGILWQDTAVVMDVVCAHLGVNPAELSGPSRRQQICQARALISY